MTEINPKPRGRAALRNIGLAAFVVFLFVPEVAFFVLLGIATSWWLAGVVAGGSLLALVTAYAASRSRRFLGRVFGTTDYDPADYSQWTRYLVIRPLIASLPASIAFTIAIVVTAAYNVSPAATVGISAASGMGGLVLGGALWLRFENRRRAVEGQLSRERRGTE